MCGRFTLRTNLNDWIDWYIDEPVADLPASVEPRYNIAPTQTIWTIARGGNGFLKCIPTAWGLVPRWAKAASIGSSMINARCETVLEKPSFRKPIQNQRCVIPADGYYEWAAEQDGKQPYWISRSSQQPFVFAAVWEQNTALGQPGRPLLTASILTSHANEALMHLHHRMPVMLLDRGSVHRWLQPGPIEADELPELCRPPADDALTATRVSRRVNSVRHQGPELLESE